MSFLGQFSFGYPVVSQNIITTIPNEAIVPLSIGSSLKGNILGVSFADLKSQIGSTRYIGEEYGGGIVFHIWKDSQGIEHGLIVTKVNLSTAQWSNITNVAIGASAQSTFNGLSNSTAIINQPGHINSAAKICLDSTEGGYNDWYLPAVDEAILIGVNRFNINKSLSQIPGAALLPWSGYIQTSTENSANVNMGYSLGDFYTLVLGKANPIPIRAVRQF